MPEETAPLDPLERFHRAWFAPSLRLLRFNCRPFCLGHLIIFQALDLPFARLGDPNLRVTTSDLIIALRICDSARWPFAEMPRLAAIDERRWRRMERSKKHFELASDEFCRWLVQCSLGPELLDDEDSKPLSAPMVLGFGARLISKGFSEKRTFTMPLSLVRSYAAAFSEQEGGTRFLTADDLAAIAHHQTLPDFSQMSDEELYPIVVKDLGPDKAAAWLKRRHAERQVTGA